MALAERLMFAFRVKKNFDGNNDEVVGRLGENCEQDQAELT